METAPEQVNHMVDDDEFVVQDNPLERPNSHYDDKGRLKAEHMGNPEKLSEILTILRTTQDAMEQIVATASKNPMFKMLGIGKGL